MKKLELKTPKNPKLTTAQRKKRKRGRKLPTKYEKVLAAPVLDRDTVPDAPKKRSGKLIPNFIDVPGLREKIIEKVRDGHHPDAVARYCGISPNIFMEWMKRGAEGKDKEHYDFYIDVMKADAEGEMAGIDQIRVQSYDNWTARAWLLERRYPERWGRQQAIKHDHNVNVSGDTTVTVRNELSSAVLDNKEIRNALRSTGTVTDAEFEES